MNERNLLATALAIALATSCQDDTTLPSTQGGSSSGQVASPTGSSSGASGGAQTATGSSQATGGSGGSTTPAAGGSTTSTGGADGMGGTTASMGGATSQPDGGTGASMAGASGAATAGGSNTGGAGGSSSGSPSCAIVQRYPLVNVPGGVSAPVARRIAGEFGVGPWRGADVTEEVLTRWLRIDLEGMAETVYSSSAAGGGFLTFTVAPPDHVLSLSDFADIPMGRLQAGDESWTIPDYLMDGVGFDTRFPYAGGISLDGERGLVMLFGSGSEGTGAARLRMFSSAGEGVGELVVADDYAECETMLPTQHGVVYAQNETNDFALREFGPDGDVVAEVSIDLDGDSSCRMLALTEGGFAALALNARELQRMSRDGTVMSERLDGLNEIPSAFAVAGDATIWVSNVDGEPTIVWHRGGEDLRFPVDIAPYFAQIPSEAGTLFLDVNPTQLVDAPREIVEVACTE